MISYWFDQDTFRGRVCECPVVNGVQYKGDGYTSCEGKPVMVVIPQTNLSTHWHQ